MMRIGLSFDLKETVSAADGAPDDALEEYDSFETVSLIASSLESLGHEVTLLGGGRDFLLNIQNAEGLDIVFNIAEGRGNYPSREAQVPSVLEMLGIPYTGSSPLCLSVCLDKALTKTLLKASSIRTPEWQIVKNKQELEDICWDSLNFPIVVKLAFEGSSKGIRANSFAANPNDAMATATYLLSEYGQPVILEEYIGGEEITVGITGNPAKVLGVMRIIPRTKDSRFLYSIEVKRNYKNLVDYECPAQLGKEIIEKIESVSLKIFNTLECRDFARLDFKISAGGTPYFLEINPLPGLGNHSDLVIMAQALGISHSRLVASVLKAALDRYKQCAAV